MSRNFVIQMDASRLSGTIDVTVNYMATATSGSSNYISTVSGALVFMPIIQTSSSVPSNIPFIQQVNGPVSLKNTSIAYKLYNGGK